MAAVHGQRTYAQYAVPTQEDLHPPPSPTLTNPDLILPNEPRYSTQSPTYVDVNYSRPTSRTLNHHRSDSDGSNAELGVATAVVMPVRLSVGPPASVSKSAQLSAYQGYEHGAPLSDIGEEETEPEEEEEDDDGEDDDRSKTPRDLRRSPTPEEVDDIAAEVEKLAVPQLRHKKRLSNVSVDSADSDKTEWEKFDTTKLMSDRVAADIVQARNAADVDSVASRRNSKETEDELSALNDRAEQILESARKRLSHMEDNLSKARHSITLSSPRSSPNMHELGLGQQPVGGLYRSISQSAQNRRSRGFPVKPNTTMSHGRAGSDNVVAGGTNRQSRTPELRSVSALEYGRPWLGVATPDRLQNSQSPSSSRSFNSPLRMLAEEAESPSTVKTSPDSGSTSTDSEHQGSQTRSSAAKAQDDLHKISRHDQSGTPSSIERSNSQASTRSARDLRDQMSEMKSRIAELKSKAQADTLRRRSVQNLRSSSPLTSSSPEGNGQTQWRPASPAYWERAGTSLGHATGAGNGWRSVSQQSHHHRKDSALDEDSTPLRMPITPTMNRLLNLSTPAGTASARTDRNTPNLVQKNEHHGVDRLDFTSHGAHSSNEDAERSPVSEDDEDEVYANEEEQIYLNEVLEESLHEPDVPSIPMAYLAQGGNGEERHEDRLDAFDYENMFLHSAMGTYTGHSDSDDDSETDSVETSRRDTTTPTKEHESDNSDNDSNGETGLNDSDEDQSDVSSPLSPSSPVSSRDSPLKSQSLTDSMDLKQPIKPWMKPARSNSMDSTSSAATFETATEGHGRGSDDEDNDSPDEILNWGNDSDHALQLPPQDQTLASSPLGATGRNDGHNRHDGGTGIGPSTNNVSTTGKLPGHTRSQSGSLQNVSSSVQPTSQRSVSAADYHSQQIPQYVHHRTDSADMDDGTEGQTTPVASHFPQHLPSTPRSRVLHISSAASPSSSRHSQDSSTSTVTTIQQPTVQFPVAENSSSPKSTSSVQSQHQLPSRVLDHSSIPTPNQPSPATTSSTPHSAHPANTEILMESLIKLADPSFTIGPDTRFAEVDKELVLNLLRALGGVCNGVLRADKQGESQLVKELRGRLRDGEEVLIHGLGGDEDEEDDGESSERNQSVGDDGASDVQTVTGLGIEGAPQYHHHH